MKKEIESWFKSLKKKKQTELIIGDIFEIKNQKEIYIILLDIIHKDLIFEVQTELNNFLTSGEIQENGDIVVFNI